MPCIQTSLHRAILSCRNMILDALLERITWNKNKVKRIMDGQHDPELYSSSQGKKWWVTLSSSSNRSWAISDNASQSQHQKFSPADHIHFQTAVAHSIFDLPSRGLQRYTRLLKLYNFPMPCIHTSLHRVILSCRNMILDALLECITRNKK